MTPVAWLVLGEPHLRAVFLDQERAVSQAAGHHGIVKNLVLEEGVLELVRAAYARGLADGRELPKETTA